MIRNTRPECRRRLTVHAACVLMLLLLAMPAWATRLIKPGEPIQLRADEGLVLVSIDTDFELASVRFRREGARIGGGIFRSLQKGRTARLYAVPAGRYHWTRLTRLDTWVYTGWVDVADDKDFAFSVEAGRINYPGDLVYRGGYFHATDLRLANRGLAALDWLRATHPGVQERYAFAYSGRYPDPFPGVYMAARNGDPRSDGELEAVAAPPVPASALPLPPRELWKEPRIVDIALSPDGRLVAQGIREETPAGAVGSDPKGASRGDAGGGGKAETRWAIDLFDIAQGTNVRVLVSDMPFEDIRWESDRILLATMDSPAGEWLQILHIDAPPTGVLSTRRVTGPVGTLVDMLHAEPGVVLYQRGDHRGQIAIHRLDLADEKAVRRFQSARLSERLNAGISGDLHWLTDGRGRLRAYFTQRKKQGDEDESEIVLMHGEAGRFREAMVYDPRRFRPLSLSFDGERLFGLSDDERGQRDLVEYDLQAGRIVRTVHSKPGVDLVRAVFDEAREPVAVLYYRDGELITEYFDATNRRLVDQLRRAFPGRSVRTIQRSRDGGTMVLVVDGIDQPPQLYLLDVGRQHAGLLDDIFPGLAQRSFSPAQVIKARGEDGLEIDAFLTLPRAPGRRPLIVMPHGGPIGVSDDLHFNRDVQFLASLGYAVLQVNFRGSEGYGKAFREAGLRNFGRMIESDIDVAIRAALARHPVDADRMCIVGASYGGYSAMVSPIRWPGRFRCAVSIAGISDRALLFTASDGTGNEKTRAELVRMMGDPNRAADFEDMLATSPLYRSAELAVPLMLVHGREDARVDFEHSRRLVRMLNLAGRQPVGLFFDKEGHGVEEIDNVDAMWSGIAAFLARHLGEPQPPAGGVPAP